MSRILQISDPHIMIPPGKVSNKLETLLLFEQVIDHILENMEKIAPVDVVISTGDIADIGDVQSYQAFRKQIERLGLPYLMIPGNHDLRAPMHHCFKDLGFMPESGKINWVHDLKDLRIIGLDSLIEGKGGGLFDAASARFLERALAGAAQKPVLLAIHHPPIKSGIWFMDKIGLEGHELLAETLRPFTNEIRIISGHLHASITGTINDRVVVVGPSTCSAFATDYRADAPVGFMTGPRGYVVHDWDNGFRSNCTYITSFNGPHGF